MNIKKQKETYKYREQMRGENDREGRKWEKGPERYKLS